LPGSGGEAGRNSLYGIALSAVCVDPYLPGGSKRDPAQVSPNHAVAMTTAAILRLQQLTRVVASLVIIVVIINFSSCSL